MSVSSASLDVLKKLVSFPTVSDQPNSDLIEYALEYSNTHAVLVHREHDPIHDKSSILLRYGPEKPGGILLSGHTDVVPVNSKEWASDPFRVSIRDGKAYGRGTTDMKGFLALALAAGNTYSSLQRPVFLALTYDEEVGCLSAPPLIQATIDHLNSLEAVIVGEPSMLRPAAANKSIAEFITEFSGAAAHSSKPHLGVNAVEIAAEYIMQLKNIITNINSAGTAIPGGDANKADPPWTTSQVGTIRGGSATNIVPDRCRISYDLRSFLNSDRELFKQKIEGARQNLIKKYKLADTAITTSQACDVPPLEFRPDSPALRLAQSLSGSSQADWVPYATEAGQYQQAGLSTIILGPGSIEQAHQTDEFLSLEQLKAGDLLMQALFERQKIAL